MTSIINWMITLTKLIMILLSFLLMITIRCLIDRLNIVLIYTTKIENMTSGNWDMLSGNQYLF
jgi:hypothetical protein